MSLYYPVCTLSMLQKMNTINVAAIPLRILTGRTDPKKPMFRFRGKQSLEVKWPSLSTVRAGVAGKATIRTTAVMWKCLSRPLALNLR